MNTPNKAEALFLAGLTALVSGCGAGQSEVHDKTYYDQLPSGETVSLLNECIGINADISKQIYSEVSAIRRIVRELFGISLEEDEILVCLIESDDHDTQTKCLDRQWKAFPRPFAYLGCQSEAEEPSPYDTRGLSEQLSDCILTAHAYKPYPALMKEARGKYQADLNAKNAETARRLKNTKDQLKNMNGRSSR